MLLLVRSSDESLQLLVKEVKASLREIGSFMKHWKLTLLLTTVLLAQFRASGHCADQIVMQFHDKPSVDGNMVQLGDLVKVLSGKSESIQRLMTLPLSPAPLGDKPQTWQSSDVIQHLSLRGVHPASIRWFGATNTTLVRVVRPDKEALPMAPAFLQDRALKQAEDNVHRAITEYLSLKVGEAVDFRVEAQLPIQFVQTLQSRRNIVSIGGGREPWFGMQEFVLEVKQSRNTVQLSVKAQVKLPPMVVAAKRPLRREEIITADALTYSPLPPQLDVSESTSPGSNYFTSIDELVGKQLLRAVSTGLTIQSSYVGEPILVSRNALVEVESVAGGIVVSTQGKALGSGAQGELIQVELLANRQKLYATIVDGLTVRIAAQSNRVAK